MRPAKAKAIANGIVDFFGGCYAIFDQPERLTPDRFKQTIRDESVDFLAHFQRLHAQRVKDQRRPVHDPIGGLLASNKLHQRQQVNRVKGVRNDQVSRLFKPFLNLGRQQTAG